MGLATAIETKIDLLLSTFVTNASSALCSALVPLALTGTTIYIFLMGWAVMRGEAQDSFHTLLVKCTKIAFISALALGGGEYQGSVVDGINGIQGAFTQAFGNVGSIGGMIDNMSVPYDALGSAYFSRAMSASSFIPDMSLLLAGCLIAIAQAALFIIGLGLYLIAKVALALVFAVGPAFVLCAMWPATQRFTESWLGQALNYVLLNAFIAAAIAMLTSLATQTAADLQTNLDTANALMDSLAVLMCAGALCVVQLNLNSIASALGGGASISGIGRDVGRKAMEMLNSKGEGGGKSNSGGGQMANAGSGGANQTSTPASSTTQASSRASAPIYQRHTLDNIRRSSIS